MRVPGLAAASAWLGRVRARPRAWRTLGCALLLALVLFAVLRSHLGTRRDGFTIDEPWHTVAGISAVRTGDYRLNPEHPPLVKLWVGALAPDGFVLPPLPQLVDKLQEREFVESTMFTKNDAARAQAATRAAMWTFHAALMFVLGLLLWRTLGLAWAIGTLAFLALDPTVTANMPVVMTDLPLGILLAISALCAGQLAATWAWRWVGGAGLALGLTLASKHSGLVGVLGIGAALTIAALLALRGDGGVREAARRLGKVAVLTAIAVIVLWGCYGFHFHAGPDGTDLFNRPLDGKIADLHSGVWRTFIEVFDRHHLLPRAYLWGLADTVRVGVEGASRPFFFLGELRFGAPPLHFWPTLLAVKLPLALISIAVIGAALLRRSEMSSAGRWALAAASAACALHLLALVKGNSTYAGIRHAVPVIVGLALLGGAAVAGARRRRPRLGAVVGALFFATLATTAREPRLWEYHNELVGGTDDAFRYFDNEGVYIGQGIPGVRDYYERVIAATGLPVYFSFFSQLVGAEIDAAGIRTRDFVEGMDDHNFSGVFEGYFVFPMRMTTPKPNWIPEQALAGLTLVQRLGNVGIWRGRFVRPQMRANEMFGLVIDYVYQENGTDFALVASRLEESAPHLGPANINSAYLELGNAYLRLGDRAGALRAFRRPLTSPTPPIDPEVRALFEAQVARIEAATDLSKVPLMTNIYLE